MSDSTLVRSQKRRAVVVLQVIRFSNASFVPLFPDMLCMEQIYVGTHVSIHERRTLFVLVTCRFQNPNIPRAVWVRAAHGGAAGRGGAGQHGSGGPEANGPSSPPGYRGQLSWTSLCKHEQRKSYVHGWRNKTRGWQPVHARFIRGLSAGPRALFVPGCWPVYRRLFVSVNPSHARHVRE